MVVDFVDKLGEFVMKVELWDGNIKEGNYITHLSAALQGEERVQGSIGQLVQAHRFCMGNELET